VGVSTVAVAAALPVAQPNKPAHALVLDRLSVKPVAAFSSRNLSANDVQTFYYDKKFKPC
jgi:hypothetical protein